EHDGIRKDMGVITPDGVVGKVIETYPNTAQVLLLTDEKSGVGAMLADPRIQSPVGGVGGPLLTMKYVPNDDDVSVGSRVVTGGMDRIYASDCRGATITEVRPGSQGFKQLRVRPAENLESLEEVLVLLTLHPLKQGDSAAEQPPTPAANSAPPQVSNP